MLLEEKGIFLNVALKSKQEVLEFIATQAKQLNLCDSKEGVLHDLWIREKEFSTGLQDGFAIPHARSAHIKTAAILFLNLDEAIEWKTMDDSLVTCIFTLLVPIENQGNQHLQMLSTLATCLLEDEFKDYVKAATNVKELQSYVYEMMEVN